MYHSGLFWSTIVHEYQMFGLGQKVLSSLAWSKFWPILANQETLAELKNSVGHFDFFFIHSHENRQSFLTSKVGLKFWSSRTWQYFLTQTKHFAPECISQNCKFMKLRIQNVLGHIVYPYQTVYVFYYFNWEIWVVVSSMHNVTSNHFSPCIYF